MMLQRQSQLVSPVPSSDIAAELGYLSPIPTDVLARIDSYNAAAAQMAETYSRISAGTGTFLLLLRATEQPRSLAGLRPIGYSARTEVELPVWPVLSVQQVLAGGEPIEFSLTQGKPDTISIKPTTADLAIAFTVGAGTSAVYLQAIKQLAAYLFEHSGSCSLTDAMQQSGAAGLLDTVRMYVGGL
jgi:hypothetical protein